MNKPATHPDTREHILAVGELLILGRGFTALGLAELLSTAGVPKGSFYHYFKSKEAFGEALLTRYFDEYDLRMDTRFNHEAGPMRTKLLDYFEQWVTSACDTERHGSCLAVKLAAEVCDLSEPMRAALDNGMAHIVSRIAAAIEAGMADGSLTPVAEPAKLAEALYSTWLGAALRAKVGRTLAPLEAARADTEQRLPAL
ncbi:TetR/AcrR family transcriptional regulator [Crenobacter sp. SG2303]|uniref:TetR/AcrR family transcriptional regulator n=1 Tax=Crenobacter oryzisoli TaxID=3056844 RepID=A0ABT7XNU4_9NEIS|nr:TetR/AcrR family transcriptional regulator [Crenobacter sp. SG2303]MDN0075464.1 TetR/AcrR family transcriptional regulator [Crenobacter sp. SG2303]